MAKKKRNTKFIQMRSRLESASQRDLPRSLTCSSPEPFLLPTRCLSLGLHQTKTGHSHWLQEQAEVSVDLKTKTFNCHVKIYAGLTQNGLSGRNFSCKGDHRVCTFQNKSNSEFRKEVFLIASSTDNSSFNQKKSIGKTKNVFI